jgi:DNA (cytosine-5)-methyltransferase 1
MPFPDNLDSPARTIITSEGGKSPSRFKHVIKDGERFRRLTPIELEKLNMFPPDFTNNEGVSNSKRAFLMGNALVVGLVEKIGIELGKRIRKYDR